MIIAGQYKVYVTVVHTHKNKCNDEMIMSFSRLFIYLRVYLDIYSFVFLIDSLLVHIHLLACFSCLISFCLFSSHWFI